MKTRLITFIILLISIATMAQKAINYKALIKDDSGNVLVNQPIAIQFTILQGVSQTNVYQETHTVSTDANGIVITNIGNGTVNNGNFSTIDWGSNDHFLNVQIDSGSGLVDLGTTQFKAVPYALYAETSGNNATGLEALDEGNGIGWRLIDSDPSAFGDIGINALDLSRASNASVNNGALGSNSNAIGLNQTSSGQQSTAIGNNSVASGSISVTIGNEAFASGNHSIAIGNQIKSEAYKSVAIGLNNIGGGNPIGWNLADPLFEIGNGASTSSPSNALTILKNGTITAPSFDISEITNPKALITKEYADTNYLGVGTGISPTGLEAIDEGNGLGWRLIGRDPDGYDNLGNGAVDFSYGGNGAIGGHGASGLKSFAAGHWTTASGTMSTSIGYWSTASGAYSTAIGDTNFASGNNSLAVGFNTEASGSSSAAFGFQTEASGTSSVAMGSQTIASGSNSFAFGSGNLASGSYSMAMGYQTEANQIYALAMGESTVSSGISSVAMGAETTASGNGSFAMGDSNTAAGSSSVALGFQTNVTHDYSFAMGNNVNVSAFAASAFGYDLINDDTRSFLVGKHNDNTTTSSSLFMVGNGLNTTNRSNAFEVLENGRILAPSLDVGEITDAKSLVTKEYLEGNYIGITSTEAPSGLETLNEGNGAGRRLIGVDPANYGNIGNHAVDLSISDLPSTTYGATGNYSATVGRRTTASGYASTAMGIGTIADGQSQLVIGQYNNPWGAGVLFQIGDGQDEDNRGTAFLVLEGGDALLTGSLTQNSDRRLKQDIIDLDYGLDAVLKLKPVSYHWKKHPNKPKSLGLIAQEVQPIIEEIIHISEDENKTLSVSYIELIPVLIKAIQEQQVIIDNQKQIISSQEETNTKQTEALQALLERVEALEKKSDNSVKWAKN